MKELLKNSEENFTKYLKLPLKNIKTAEYIREKLKEYGIPYERNH